MTALRRQEYRLGATYNATFEGDLALGGLAGDHVGLGADDVEDDVVGQVAAEFGQPGAHVGKALGVGDGVAQDAGISAPVVEARDGAEPFLAGCKWPKERDGQLKAIGVRQSRRGLDSRP